MGTHIGVAAYTTPKVDKAGVGRAFEQALAEIKRVVPDARISIAGPVPQFALDLDPGDVAHLLPGLPATTLRQGIERTVAFYRANGNAL